MYIVSYYIVVLGAAFRMCGTAAAVHTHSASAGGVIIVIYY